jgi:hypothetical protein
MANLMVAGQFDFQMVADWFRARLLRARQRLE